jgi:hypothetical protein
LLLLFATGINNTSGTSGKFTAFVIDAGGKFATVVDDTGAAPWLANISANFHKNLPPVLLILVVHLDLQISSEFLKKFEITLFFPVVTSKMIHEKT